MKIELARVKIISNLMAYMSALGIHQSLSNNRVNHPPKGIQIHTYAQQ
jgi:hypothetical protein